MHWEYRLDSLFLIWTNIGNDALGQATDRASSDLLPQAFLVRLQRNQIQAETWTRLFKNCI